MTKVTIVPSDHKVYVNDIALDIDVDDLPEYVHAIQWDGSKGEIEFKQDRYGNRLTNVKITDFKSFDYIVQRWEARRDYITEKQKREAEEVKTRQNKAREDEEEKRQEKLL